MLSVEDHRLGRVWGGIEGVLEQLDNLKELHGVSIVPATHDVAPKKLKAPLEGVYGLDLRAALERGRQRQQMAVQKTNVPSKCWDMSSCMVDSPPAPHLVAEHVAELSDADAELCSL